MVENMLILACGLGIPTLLITGLIALPIAQRKHSPGRSARRVLDEDQLRR